MSDFQEKLEKEVQEHNELHNQIQAGEEQLVAMKADRDRRVGRIQLLQELAKDEAPESVSGEVVG